MLTRSTITLNDTECSYYRGGQGRPLLFLHGFTTEPGFEFATRWCAGFDVIIPFHPGFGTSGDAPASDDLHDLVLHHVELIDRLGLGTAHLVGHSLGGHVAARIASEHPRYVEKLVLACPTGLRVAGEQALDIIAVPPEVLAAKLYAAPVAADRSQSAARAGSPPVAAHAPAPATKGAPGRSADRMVDRYREASSVARLLWTRPFDRKLPRYLHRVAAPTLILWGEADQIVPMAHAKSWQTLVPQARVDSLPGLGHLLFNEAAEPALVVERFLGEKS